MVIKRYIECNYEPEVCNLNCDYCYLRQQNRKKQTTKKESYSPKYVRKALSKERLDGVCFFSLSVAGETMHSDYIIEIALELLREGHIVNITTNGTMYKKVVSMLSHRNVPYEHLLITFSFHYLELLRTNLMDTFWKSVKYVRSKRVSFYIKLNLYDGYIPYLNQIFEICEKEIGEKPQIEVTRKENGDSHTFMTKLTPRKYNNAVECQDSKLFAFTFENFNKNRRGYFCYAGAWSLVVDLRDGTARGCYCDKREQNIYNLNKKIEFLPIGNNCSAYCHNGQHFLAMGVIPELQIPSYIEMRQYAGNVSLDGISKLMHNCKLIDSNVEYSKVHKFCTNVIYKWKIANG